MKKLIILCLLCALAVLLHFKCDAQPHFNMGAGYDIKTQKPVGCIAAGYTVAHLITLQGSIQASLTRQANVNNYFGGSAGLYLPVAQNMQIIPAAGYYYNLRNGDDKSQNTAAIGY